MFCSQCGTNLPESSKFCSKCGKPLVIQEDIKKSPQNNNGEKYDERSGKGKDSIIPKEIIEWNWGAAGLSIIWGIYNNVWISFLTFIVPLGFIIMGKVGNGWAWRNKKWKSVEEFKKSQAKWQPWGKVFFIIIIVINLIPYLALYQPQNNLNTNSAENTKLNTPCTLGYIKSDINGQCVTRDQDCKEKHGPFSTWVGDFFGICSCKVGFIMNKDGKCVARIIFGK